MSTSLGDVSTEGPESVNTWRYRGPRTSRLTTWFRNRTWIVGTTVPDPETSNKVTEPGPLYTILPPNLGLSVRVFVVSDPHFPRRPVSPGPPTPCRRWDQGTYSPVLALRPGSPSLVVSSWTRGPLCVMTQPGPESRRHSGIPEHLYCHWIRSPNHTEVSSRRGFRSRVTVIPGTLTPHVDIESGTLGSRRATTEVRDTSVS